MKRSTKGADIYEPRRVPDPLWGHASRCTRSRVCRPLKDAPRFREELIKSRGSAGQFRCAHQRFATPIVSCPPQPLGNYGLVSGRCPRYLLGNLPPLPRGIGISALELLGMPVNERVRAFRYLLSSRRLFPRQGNRGRLSRVVSSSGISCWACEKMDYQTRQCGRGEWRQGRKREKRVSADELCGWFAITFFL